MKLAMIGLGKMGANMARRLIRDGHEVVGYNLEAAVTDELAAEVGLIPAYSLAEVVGKLSAPLVAWVMVPSGKPTESVVSELSSSAQPGRSGGGWRKQQLQGDDAARQNVGRKGHRLCRCGYKRRHLGA